MSPGELALEHRLVLFGVPPLPTLPAGWKLAVFTPLRGRMAPVFLQTEMDLGLAPATMVAFFEFVICESAQK